MQGSRDRAGAFFMSDVFQTMDVDADYIVDIVSTLERRTAEPKMIEMIDAYLDRLDVPDACPVVEVGAGTGCVSRHIAQRFPAAEVKAFEPWAALLEHGRKAAEPFMNLTLEVASGEALPLADGSVGVVVVQTVLSHAIDQDAILKEAMRVLFAGGQLVVFDGDFAKTRINAFENDPLQACVDYFNRHFCADPYLGARLRPMVKRAGFEIEAFTLTNWVTTEDGKGRTWIDYSTRRMVEEGEISEALSTALREEYDRRAAAGTLFAVKPYVTLIARKP